MSMATLRDVTAPPVTMEFGGRQWKLAPLTIGDLGELEQWCIDQPVNRLMKRLNDIGANLPTEAKVKLLSEAIHLASTQTLADEGPVREASSNEGRIQELWLSIRRADPSLKEEDFRAAVNNSPEGTFGVELVTALKALRVASGLGGGGKDGTDKGSAGSDPTAAH